MQYRKARRSGTRATSAWLLAGLCAAILLTPAPGVAQDRLTLDCRSPPTAKDHVTGVTAWLDLVIADGRMLRVVGIEPPLRAPAGKSPSDLPRRQLAGWLVGKDVGVAELDGAPDRWGRILAQVYAPIPDASGGNDQQPSLSITWALLDAGLARLAPMPAIQPCAASLLIAERAARDAHLGIWSDPAYRVIAADDHASLAAAAGRVVLVEGRVASIGTGRQRTYLNLGPARGRDLAVTVLNKQATIFQAAGRPLAGLQGRDVRVRGLLDMRFGPQIAISDPDAIEFLLPPPAGSSREQAHADRRPSP